MLQNLEAALVLLFYTVQTHAPFASPSHPFHLAATCHSSHTTYSELLHMFQIGKEHHHKTRARMHESRQIYLFESKTHSDQSRHICRMCLVSAQMRHFTLLTWGEGDAAHGNSYFPFFLFPGIAVSPSPHRC
ncbi:hypothetical protein B0H14DRAFT_2865863, partial [Mycena olivaceomarginata]